MEAVNRVHTAEDALGEFSAEAEAERAKAVDAKSAMKSRELGDKRGSKTLSAESDRDAAVERAKTAEEARFKAESELERSRSSPASKELADARHVTSRGRSRGGYQPSPRRPRRSSRGERRYHHPSSSSRASPTRPEPRDSVSQTQLDHRPPPPSSRPAFEPNSIEPPSNAKDPASIPNERSRRVVHHPTKRA